MNLRNHHLFALTVLAFGLAIGSARAGTIYDNTATAVTNGLGQPVVYPMANDVALGEEIFPANLAAFPILTNFSFSYYSPTYNSSSGNGWNGQVQADVQFFLNTGAPTNGYATPASSPFYETGWFDLANPLFTFPGINVVTEVFGFSDIYGPNPQIALPTNFTLPSDFTVMLTFDGLTNGNIVSLPLFKPPAVGTNYGDYWVRDNSGNWELATNAAGFNGLGLTMTASAVPEPSTSGLAAIGVGIALASRLVRRRK